MQSTKTRIRKFHVFFLIAVQFSASDFDYLETFDNNKQSVVARDSLLLKFDPLLKQPVPHHNIQNVSQIVEESEQDVSDTVPVKTFADNCFRNPFETSIEETQSPPELDQLNEVTVAVPVKEQEKVVAERSEEKTSDGAGDETMSITFVNNNVMKDVNTIEDGLKSELKIMRCVLRKNLSTHMMCVPHIWRYIYLLSIFCFVV